MPAARSTSSPSDLDFGPVIAQSKVRILPRDDADSLAERVLEAEHELYPGGARGLCPTRCATSRD